MPFWFLFRSYVFFCYVSAQDCGVGFGNYPFTSYFTFTVFITTSIYRCIDLSHNNPNLFAADGDSLQKCTNSNGWAAFNIYYSVPGIYYFMVDCNESNGWYFNVDPPNLAAGFISQLVKLTQPQDVCTSFSFGVSVIDTYGNVEVNNNGNYTCSLSLTTPDGDDVTQYLSGILNMSGVQGVCDFTGLGISTAGDFIIIVSVNIGLSASITVPTLVNNVNSIAISTTQTTFTELEIFEVQVIMQNTNFGTCIGEAVLSVFSVTTEIILSETISSD